MKSLTKELESTVDGAKSLCEIENRLCVKQFWQHENENLISHSEKSIFDS
jgi:hypothetical protein